MWDKSIPFRSLRISLKVLAVIAVGVLIKLLISEPTGTWSDVAVRTTVAFVIGFGALWTFFVVYLFFKPNYDGYLDKYGGDGYGKADSNENES